MNREHIKKMEEKIETMNERIDVFQKELKKLPKKASHEFTVTMGDIQNKYDKLETKFETLKKATDSATNDINVGVQMAWDDLNVALDVAKDRFENIAS